MTTIHVVNESTAVHASDVHHWEVSVAAQAHAFARQWGIGVPRIRYTPEPEMAVAGDVVIAVLDDADQANALGYHSEEGGVAYGRVFAKVSRDAGVPLSSVLSHEVLEAIADLACNRWVQADNGALWALEVCDPVESSTYTDARGVTLSSYVLPSWADPQGQPPFDPLGELTAPLTVAAHGYAVVMTGGRPREIFGDRYDPRRRAAKQHELSRSWKRLHR